jgi:hypothetical protein
MYRLLILLFVAAYSEGNAAELMEEFNGPELNQGVWNTCQARTDLLRFGSENDGGILRRFLQIIVNESTADVDQCLRATASIGLAGFADPHDKLPDAAFENGADLGPSLIVPGQPRKANPEACPTGGSVQRNELRFNNIAQVHGWTEPHWYSLAFRIDGQVFHCGSARWVVGQWKQRIAGDKSPVLAQRFDNGVLHVTVQDDDCRCMVAKASGDPARVGLVGASVTAQEESASLKESKPLKCVDSTVLAGEPEKVCEPKGLTVLTIGGRPPPDLPDPSMGWLTMTYRVKGGENGQIDVYANDRFIVRVSGHIGYATPHPGDVKFKIGHYRDRVPGDAVLKIDKICLSKFVGDCDPGLRPFSD